MSIENSLTSNCPSTVTYTVWNAVGMGLRPYKCTEYYTVQVHTEHISLPCVHMYVRMYICTCVRMCIQYVFYAVNWHTTHPSKVQLEVYCDHSSHSSESCVVIGNHIGAGTDRARVWDNRWYIDKTEPDHINLVRGKRGQSITSSSETMRVCWPIHMKPLMQFVDLPLPQLQLS